MGSPKDYTGCDQYVVRVGFKDIPDEPSKFYLLKAESIARLANSPIFLPLYTAAASITADNVVYITFSLFFIILCQGINLSLGGTFPDVPFN